jgi:hypothetical protein
MVGARQRNRLGVMRVAVAVTDLDAGRSPLTGNVRASS